MFNIEPAAAAELLRSKTAFIAGLGGLGGYVAEELARSGVGKIIAYDGDVFQESNLNRQLLSNKLLLGKSKFEALKERVERISDTKVEGGQVFISEDNIDELACGCDIIIDCCDNVKSRFALQSYAEKKGLFLVHGAACGYLGQVSVISPGSGTLKKIYPKSEGTVGHTPAPAPAIVGSIEASEALRVLLGLPSPILDKLLLIDLSSLTFVTLSL
ncbi:MAG: HesA/MoeB/ThiF family protein [Clostridiales bacterium]|nr:HesA/MoeB/ThiF family protein [Clostridiales bacterium]